MTESANAQVVLVKRPGVNGHATVDCFECEKCDDPVVTDLAEGQCIVRTLFLSIDPALRCRMNENTGVAYMAAWPLNERIDGLGGVGVVEQTTATCPLALADIVTSAQIFWPWARRFKTDADYVTRVTPIPGQSPSIFLSCLGMVGLTSLLGIDKMAKIHPSKGQTMVVSGAAGACGTIAGQIGRLRGCKRVIGICGSDDKCQLLVTKFGFDAAINYKTDKVSDKMKEFCPQGVDVYFDNVGGSLSDVVISQMNENGSIVLCGQISLYNKDVPYPPPIAEETQSILTDRRISRERFLVLNYQEDYDVGLEELGRWLQNGQLKVQETITTGIENAGQAFVDMMNGRNVGKQLVKVL